MGGHLVRWAVTAYRGSRRSGGEAPGIQRPIWCQPARIVARNLTFSGIRKLQRAVRGVVKMPADALHCVGRQALVSLGVALQVTS